MGRTVSVVITTHYRNDALRDAIESALAQSYADVQIVVVDDSGSDHAEAVVEEYDVAYVGHERNRGQVSSWQTGVEATDGEYVQLLDDDDWLDERKLSKQVERLRTNRDVGVVYCGLLFSDGRTARPAQNGRGDVLDDALTLHMPACTTSSLLVERSVLECVLPLGDYRAGTDLPLKIELARRTQFDFVDELLAFRGVAEGSQGKSKRAARARRRVLSEYRELYRDAPEWVGRRALATTLRFEAMVYWREDGLSSRAVLDFARVLRVAENRRVLDGVCLLLSLLGGTGHAIGRRGKRWIEDDRTTGRRRWSDERRREPRFRVPQTETSDDRTSR